MMVVVIIAIRLLAELVGFSLICSVIYEGIRKRYHPISQVSVPCLDKLRFHVACINEILDKHRDGNGAPELIAAIKLFQSQQGRA